MKECSTLLGEKIAHRENSPMSLSILLWGLGVCFLPLQPLTVTLIINIYFQLRCLTSIMWN